MVKIYININVYNIHTSFATYWCNRYIKRVKKQIIISLILLIVESLTLLNPVFDNILVCDIAISISYDQLFQFCGPFDLQGKLMFPKFHMKSNHMYTASKKHESTVNNKKTHTTGFSTLRFPVYLRNRLSYKKTIYIFLGVCQL